MDIFREPWKTRQWFFFRAVLGLGNVWDVFLVSHIKVVGKSKFSSWVRMQAELLRSWVGGHVARRALIWLTMGFDRLVFRRWFQGLDLMVVVLQTWTHVAKNPCRGTDTCKLQQPCWESERACVWAWNPRKLQHYLQTAVQKVMFVMQIECCSSVVLNPAFPAGCVPSPWPNSLPFSVL